MLHEPGSGLRVCVTGSFGDVPAVERFLFENPVLVERHEFLVEIRLDLISGSPESFAALIGAIGSRAVVSCRPRWEGGSFSGPEGVRLEMLAAAARCGAGFVDIELAAWLRGAGETLKRAAGNGSRVMVSVHETGSTEYLDEHVRKLNQTGADAVKLACVTRDAGDLIRLADAASRLSAADRCVVGMGPAGAFTRMRPADFGANITFAAASKGTETADGQPVWSELVSWRVFESAGLEPVVLAGGPQVAGSPGPDVYNRIFSSRDIHCQYLPMPASTWSQAVDACRRFGIRRMAVTMPFKAEPAAFWPGASVDANVAATGSVNTVVIGENGSVSLKNTDAVGACEIFDRFGGVAGADILILGGGATARSVGIVASNAGARVTVAARNPVKVQRQWPESGMPARFKGWERRSESIHDIVVNATPVGADGRQNPMDGPGLRALTGAIDVVAAANGRTPFFAGALKDCRFAASGLDFWCAQAPAQLNAFTGFAFSHEEVRNVMLETGHPCEGVMAASGRILPGAGLEPAVVSVPGSKSLTQRYLVLASLCRYPVRIVHPSSSRDCRDLMTALGMLGVRFGQTSDTIDVYPADFPKNPGRPIVSGEGGTTVRFLSALSVLCDFPLEIEPSGAMRYRPMGPMWSALAGLGVQVSARDGIFRLERRGPPAGRTVVEGSVSSQFASALLIAGFGLSGGLTIELQGELVSRPYLDMTIQAVRLFGGVVEQEGCCLFAGPGPDTMGRRVNVEGDASLAAFWAAAESVYGRSVVLNNRPSAQDSIQGDAVYPRYFEMLRGNGPVSLNLADTPDLLPPLVVASLFREAPTLFNGVGHARVKESDRITVLVERLRQLGADIDERTDGMTIRPARLRGPAVIDPAEDHRMAMAFGVLSLRIPGITVMNPGCVEKSYPDFWQDLEKVRN